MKLIFISCYLLRSFQLRLNKSFPSSTSIIIELKSVSLLSTSKINITIQQWTHSFLEPGEGGHVESGDDGHQGVEVADVEALSSRLNPELHDPYSLLLFGVLKTDFSVDNFATVFLKEILKTEC